MVGVVGELLGLPGVNLEVLEFCIKGVSREGGLGGVEGVMEEGFPAAIHI